MVSLPAEKRQITVPGFMLEMVFIKYVFFLRIQAFIDGKLKEYLNEGEGQEECFFKWG